MVSSNILGKTMNDTRRFYSQTYHNDSPISLLRNSRRNEVAVSASKLLNSNATNSPSMARRRRSGVSPLLVPSHLIQQEDDNDYSIESLLLFRQRLEENILLRERLIQLNHRSTSATLALRQRHQQQQQLRGQYHQSYKSSSIAIAAAGATRPTSLRLPVQSSLSASSHEGSSIDIFCDNTSAGKDAANVLPQPIACPSMEPFSSSLLRKTTPPHVSATATEAPSSAGKHTREVKNQEEEEVITNHQQQLKSKKRRTLKHHHNPTEKCCNNKEQQASTDNSTMNSANVGSALDATPALKFPHKLVKMLQMKQSNGVVEWILDGRAFVILDLTVFETDILPVYFGKCKFTSFKRKLNRWGFRFDRSTKSYYHPHFVRHEPDLMQQMHTLEGKATMMMSKQSKYPVTQILR